MSKIQSFTDLVTWQEAHKLVITTYKLTDRCPNKEKFNIVSQLERAVISITNNIAEGFGRSSAKESTQFFYIALGSTKEVQNMLIASKDLGYISGEEFNQLMDQSASVSRLLHALIKANKATKLED